MMCPENKNWSRRVQWKMETLLWTQKHSSVCQRSFVCNRSNKSVRFMMLYKHVYCVELFVFWLHSQCNLLLIDTFSLKKWLYTQYSVIVWASSIVENVGRWFFFSFLIIVKIFQLILCQTTQTWILKGQYSGFSRHMVTFYNIIK